MEYRLRLYVAYSNSNRHKECLKLYIYFILNLCGSFIRAYIRYITIVNLFHIGLGYSPGAVTPDKHFRLTL